MTSVCTQPQTGNLLHGFELGLLSQHDREAFEVHLLSCDHCFADLKAFSHESSLLLNSSRLREELSEMNGMDSGATSVRPGWLELLWPQRPIVLRPAFLMAVIVLLIIPGYRGTFDGSSRGVTAVQSIWLVPQRAQSSGTFASTSKHDGVIAFQYPGARQDMEYLVDVRSSDGNVLLSDSTFSQFDQYQTGRILFPAALMRPGEYTINIRDLNGDRSLPVQSYRFRVD